MTSIAVEPPGRQARVARQLALRPGWIRGVLVTAAVIGGLELARRSIHVTPSAGIVLTLAVVYTAFVAGIAPALFSAAVGLVYAAYHLSGSEGLFHYEEPDRIRLTTIAFALPLAAVMVGALRRRADDASRAALRQQREASDSRIADSQRQIDAHRQRAQQILRRRAAKLIRVARQLKRSNDELDQFAYITSHDLRAPLRGIANLSRWIEEDIGESFPPEARKQMDLLRGRVHRMEALIDGILRYSRVGRVKVTPQAVDVTQLVREVIDLLAPPPERFRIEIVDPLPTLRTDRVRLQQVFMNLIGNAIKHHDKSNGLIRIGCRDLDEFFEFSVSDDGPGIDVQYHERVFVIFQTLEPRDKVEGTGVGLSLVKKIVEHYGGSVRISSKRGEGATFYFTWPKAEDPEGAAPR
jgi:signal transduction histidine kinase